MKSSIVVALRWLGVLPCAVAVYLLGYAFYKLIFAIQMWLNIGGDADAWINKYFFAIIASGMGGFFFVFLATMLAPTVRQYVGIVLVVLLSMIMGVAVFAGIIEGYAISIIEGVSSVVGAIIGYNQVLITEKE